MFRSFFPEPRLFFTSAIVWMLATTLLFFAIGGPLRSAISLDRFFAPAICAPGEATPAPEAQPSTPTPEATGAPDIDPSAGSAADSAVPPPSATAACVAEDPNFLNGAKLWEYQYILMVAVLFCVFWYFYKRNDWYWWSVVSTTAILLAIYAQVQVDAWVNDWQGEFFNVLQQALSQPGSVTPEVFWPYVVTIIAVTVPNILFLVMLAFFTSHYVFRWRKAMNSYYMAYWQNIRMTEGAAQRVQEDTMRLAQILEDLGTSFFSSLITLVVFLPILWGLSHHITQLPILGAVPGSLVFVALISAALGTVLLGVVGFKLPGLQFQNQLVEAAYRKELVYGEDNPTRADPPTVRELFAGVQRNYFRLYFHYTYFNLARYGYLQLAGYIPLLAMAPSILAGTLTLGIYQQVQNAFGQVSSSFQFFARAWTTIVELISVYQRLRRFESFIPHDQEPIKESLSAATS
ncbi:SbmA/BacA-like family transporter [Devosia sp. CN2-171]|uniref:peptide transporter n=1 Tax=Devosia sp. CN2-171 TaxID=3400909 RepID=UPI003BF799B5